MVQKLYEANERNSWQYFASLPPVADPVWKINEKLF